MADFVLSEKALKDLHDIWNYTVDVWSEIQADKYVEKLKESIDDIAKNPRTAGQSYGFVRRGYRGFHSGKHIIFFKILRNGNARIVRILHERMDYIKHM
ncbi:MAG: type II toxin-antitoxin system RelE/ParE family toxin [Bacteroidales bacterium]|nr:type II toxin-antitoxin system RelE/ParE family toxin [Bacteroidales bacterium]